MNDIEHLYIQGYSAQEIKDELQLDISVRQIQRRIKTSGLSRSIGDAFRLAVKRGRVTYHKSPNPKRRTTLSHKTRYIILTRDAYTCVLCGNTAKQARIEIDHIDENPTNNTLENLRTLCEQCNKGKYRANIGS